MLDASMREISMEERHAIAILYTASSGYTNNMPPSPHINFFEAADVAGVLINQNVMLHEPDKKVNFGPENTTQCIKIEALAWSP
ncbi:hypothetical protein PsYK624_091450 [Phanerochaete sordida]|uniref:Uncharacterized protein n=1 Tax=Phanerochaete sordida TaxID=48140 RepID=A0A9P3GDW5_9APHY|nr:hypothetical protein PsYK624_091450 [Phanerochaete sordida]